MSVGPTWQEAVVSCVKIMYSICLERLRKIIILDTGQQTEQRSRVVNITDSYSGGLGSNYGPEVRYLDELFHWISQSLQEDVGLVP
jgi:hypothetical protein